VVKHLISDPRFVQYPHSPTIHTKTFVKKKKICVGEWFHIEIMIHKNVFLHLEPLKTRCTEQRKSFREKCDALEKSASLKFSAIFVYIPASTTLSLTWSAQKQQQCLDNIQLRTTPHNSNSCGRSLSEFNMNTWCQLYIDQTIYSLSQFLSWLLSRDRNN